MTAALTDAAISVRSRADDIDEGSSRASLWPYVPTVPSVKRRIVIAGGGTAGHVYPALSIADAFKAKFDDVDVVFVGTHDGFEARLVPAAGYPLEIVPALPFINVGRVGKLRSLFAMSHGVQRARRILIEHDTRLVIGMGGYTSAGPLVAARSLGLYTAIHEPNIVPGMTNTLLSRLADRVYLGHRDAREAFEGRPTVFTGNPIREEIASHRRMRVRPHRDEGVRILVAGGSLGAPFLNEHVPQLLGKLIERGVRLEVRHQLGNFDADSVRRAYTRHGIDAVVQPFFDDMPDAYAWADFAIARCGASTLAELAACGVPALLVPMPNHARDHQTANALAYEAAGGGLCVTEEDWSATELAERLQNLLRDADALLELSLHAERIAVRDAACAFVEDCERAMRGRW